MGHITRRFSMAAAQQPISGLLQHSQLNRASSRRTAPSRAALLSPLRLLVAFALLFASIHRAAAEIREIEVSLSNAPWVLLGRFGFNGHGIVDLSVSHLRVYSPEKSTAPDTYSMGFLLASQSAAWEVETGIVPGVNSGNGTVGGFCPLTSLNITKIFSVMEMDAPKKGSERPTKTIQVFVPGAGFYGVYMVNCAPTRLLSAHVSLSLYNTNPGAPANAPPVKYYLSAGTIALAFVHAICGLTCLAVLCAWLAHVLKIWFHPVVPLTFHLLLTALLPALGALFFALAARLFVQQSTGSSPGIDLAADVLLVVCMALLLAAFFAGIGSIDPYMSDLERAVLFFAVPATVVSLLGLSLVSPDSLSFVVSTSVTSTASSSASSSAAVTGGSMLTSTLLPDTLPSFTVVLSVIRPLLFFLLAAAVAVITLLLFLALLLSCLQCLASRRPGANSSGGGGGMKRMGGGGGGSSYALDDRDTDGPLEKFYVQACALLLLAGAVSVLLRWCLPYDLVTWLPQALWQAALLLLLVWVLHRFRPRAERSVYQLFDENDVMDEELSEL
ncbi:unnamed protein product [Closterium sp. Yama58-4]|nr:unnamed protein product [Closterium sp. Yama58-4]